MFMCTHALRRQTGPWQLSWYWTKYVILTSNSIHWISCLCALRMHSPWASPLPCTPRYTQTWQRPHPFWEDVAGGTFFITFIHMPITMKVWLLFWTSEHTPLVFWMKRNWAVNTFFFFFKPISGVRQLTMGSGGREEVRSPESSSLSLWGHQLGCLPVLCESLGFLFETSAPNSKDPLATAQEGTKDVLPRCGLRIKIGGRPSSGQTTWLVPFPQDGGRVISECVDTSLCWPGK